MELIKINNESGIQTVDARELHEFLGSKQQYSDWIKGRIGKFEFVEGLDFTVHKFMNGRSTCIDYHISIDMAKELSMVENNEKGRKARLYFIDCEKKSQKLPQMSQLQILHAVTGEMCNFNSRLESVELTQSAIENKVDMLANAFKTIDTKQAKQVSNLLTVTQYAKKKGVCLTPGKTRGAGRTATDISKKLGYTFIKKEDSTAKLFNEDVLAMTFAKNNII